MNVCDYPPLLVSILAFLCVGIGQGQADTIDLNKPLRESLRPDILYFNFDEEANASLLSQAELPLSASVESGKVDENPTWKPGRNESFGKAIEFNYGALSSFVGPNDKIAGNHLRIPDKSELRLAGQSFTLGTWIQIPEKAEMPALPYKKLMGKGGYSARYPGWALQITQRDKVWMMSFLLVDSDSNLTRYDAQLLGGLEPGAWRHVAASFDAEAKKVTLWVDGVPILSRDATGSIGESTFPLVIGDNGMSTYCNIPLIMDDVFIVSGVHDFLPIEP